MRKFLLLLSLVPFLMLPLACSRDSDKCSTCPTCVTPVVTYSGSCQYQRAPYYLSPGVFVRGYVSDGGPRVDLAVDGAPVRDAAVTLFDSAVTYVLSYLKDAVLDGHVLGSYSAFVTPSTTPTPVFTYVPGEVYRFDIGTVKGTTSGSVTAPGDVHISDDLRTVDWTHDGNCEFLWLWCSKSQYYMDADLLPPWTIPDEVFYPYDTYDLFFYAIENAVDLSNAAEGSLLQAYEAKYKSGGHLGGTPTPIPTDTLTPSPTPTVP
jgi:hypothetical protein